MKIRKIISGLLSAVFLSGCMAVSHAVGTECISMRCRKLVDKYNFYGRDYGLFKKWQEYAEYRKNNIGQILNDLIQEEYKTKPISDLNNRIKYKLKEKEESDINDYDISSITCAENYEELIYNLATVYLTYVYIFDTDRVFRITSDARSERAMELFWSEEDCDRAKQENYKKYLEVDRKRVFEEIRRRQSRSVLSAVAESSPKSAPEAPIVAEAPAASKEKAQEACGAREVAKSTQRPSVDDYAMILSPSDIVAGILRHQKYCCGGASASGSGYGQASGGWRSAKSSPGVAPTGSPSSEKPLEPMEPLKFGTLDPKS